MGFQVANLILATVNFERKYCMETIQERKSSGEKEHGRISAMQH